MQRGVVNTNRMNVSILTRRKLVAGTIRAKKSPVWKPDCRVEKMKVNGHAIDWDVFLHTTGVDQGWTEVSERGWHQCKTILVQGSCTVGVWRRASVKTIPTLSLLLRCHRYPRHILLIDASGGDKLILTKGDGIQNMDLCDSMCGCA